MTKLDLRYEKLADDRLKLFVNEVFVGYVRIRNHYEPVTHVLNGREILFRCSHDAGGRNVQLYDESVQIERYVRNFTKVAISAYFRHFCQVFWEDDEPTLEAPMMSELETFERRQDWLLHQEAM